jgi:hypothetical protein
MTCAHYRSTPRRARLLIAAAIVSAALTLSGCGGGSSSPTVARLSSTSSAPSTGPEGNAATPESPASLQQAAVAFSRCMRSSGVPDFPDPSPDGGFLFHAGAGMNPSSPTFEKAQAKCRKLMPGGGPPGPGARTNPSAQTLARFLGIARCMRRHGVEDFPDPRTSVPSNPFGSKGGHGVISDIEGVILIFPSAIEQQSPVFTRAAAACAFPLHNH